MTDLQHFVICVAIVAVGATIGRVMAALGVL